jgi:GT2 family glycosyltransferase
VISIIVPTYNRAHLLKECVENVLFRTSALTTEIVIWNNGSTDGTQAYLDTLDDPRLRIVHHPENIAQNALRRLFALTSRPYLIALDDDVVDAPEHWDETLLEAYRRMPTVGFLCASIAYDPDDAASRYLKYMREEAGAFTPRDVNGIEILEGSVGSACTITDRELYNRVGGYTEHGKLQYWHPEVPFQRAIRKLGFTSAFLVGLEVRHAGGSSYSEPPQAKLDYHRHELKLTERKNRVKRVLLAVPFAAALNRRFRWFDPPAPSYDPGASDPRARAGPERE